MKYTNIIFTGTYKQCCEYLNASLPMGHHENWPNGPWTKITPERKPLTKEQRVEQLKLERTERENAPVYGVQVGTPTDRENVEGVYNDWELLYGESQYARFRMADNTWKNVTRGEMKSVIDAYKLRKRDLFAQYEQLLIRLETEDPDAVTWPEQ